MAGPLPPAAAHWAPGGSGERLCREEYGRAGRPYQRPPVDQDPPASSVATSTGSVVGASTRADSTVTANVT
jgi:hypothetical protein